MLPRHGREVQSFLKAKKKRVSILLDQIQIKLWEVQNMNANPNQEPKISFPFFFFFGHGHELGWKPQHKPLACGPIYQPIQKIWNGYQCKRVESGNEVYIEMKRQENFTHFCKRTMLNLAGKRGSVLQRRNRKLKQKLTNC